MIFLNEIAVYFSEDELMIGRDFWNLICKTENGLDIVIDEFKKCSAQSRYFKGLTKYLKMLNKKNDKHLIEIYNYEIGNYNPKIKKELISFIDNKASKVICTSNNGNKYELNVKDFTFNKKTGEMEHWKENVIVNLYKDILHSYSYTTDDWEQILDIQNFDNVKIV